MKSNPYPDGIILENECYLNDKCPFCMERNGISYKSYNKDLKCEFDSRIVKPRKLGDIMVFPDISPFSYGHTLICTCDHVVNFSQIQNASTVLNMEKVVMELSSHSENDKEWLFFEHGTSSCISKNGCVQHTHIHSVPVICGTYQKVVKQSCEQWSICNLEFSNLIDLYHELSKMTDRQHYVLFGRCASDGSISARYIKSDFIPSQLMRFMLSEVLEIPPHMDDIYLRSYEFNNTIEFLQKCFG